MHYLITGASGLIGQAFITSLTPDDSVTALTRDTQKAQRKLSEATCELRYISSLNALENTDGIDCIINLAGEPIVDKRWSSKQKHRIQQSRWETTTKLTALIANSNQAPAVFISGSAIGYYGRQGNNIITEQDYIVHHEFSHSLCSTWESIALGARSEHTRVCVLRTGIVLARHEGALNKMLFPFKLGCGGKIGHGNQGMSWIHIDDMVRGIHFLIQNHTLSGPFNFTAPNPVANLEFVTALAQTLKRPAILPMPAFVLRALMGESADLLLTGQFVMPKALLDAGFSFNYPTLDKAFISLV